MGIQGMHSCIRPYTRPVHLSSLSGRRVGCDGFAWLHRGAISCAQELHTKAPGRRWWEMQRRPPPYITFCMNRVRMMVAEGISPVVVLDGGRLPAKEATQNERRKRKSETLEKARRQLNAGNQAAADALFAQTLDVTPEMAHELVRALAQEGVEFVVAPYEADSQLAFFSNMEECKGGVAAVVTEDSDLIIYGCNRILFKLDSNGMGQELLLDSLFEAPPAEVKGDTCKGSVLSFRGFDLPMLRTLGVLAGCDFLPSVPGMGFKTAHALVKKYRTLSRVITIMKYEKGMKIGADYHEAAQRALQGFCHPVVFNPFALGGGEVTRLEPLPESLKEGDCDISFLGAVLPVEVAIGIATGRLHPHAPHRPLPPLSAPLSTAPAAPIPSSAPITPRNSCSWMRQAGTAKHSTDGPQVANQRSPSSRRPSGRQPAGVSPLKRARAFGMSRTQQARDSVTIALKVARTPPRAGRTPPSKRRAVANSPSDRPLSAGKTSPQRTSCESIPGDTPEAKRLEFASVPPARPAPAPVVRLFGCSPGAPLSQSGSGCSALTQLASIATVSQQDASQQDGVTVGVVVETVGAEEDRENVFPVKPLDGVVKAVPCGDVGESTPSASHSASALRNVSAPRGGRGRAYKRGAGRRLGSASVGEHQRRISSFFQPPGTREESAGVDRGEHVSVLSQLVETRINRIAENRSKAGTEVAKGCPERKARQLPTRAFGMAKQWG